MSRDELTLFSYEILGLVGRAGAGPHDLLRMAKRGRILDWAGESQYYVEPKRLARLGYLEARKEPGRTRERTVYSLTDKGLEALAAWARTPARFTPVKSDPLLRLLVADLVGEGPTRESLIGAARGHRRPPRAPARDRAGRRRAPAPRKYLLMVTAHLHKLLDLHLELVDDGERELASRREAVTSQRSHGRAAPGGPSAARRRRGSPPRCRPGSAPPARG